MFTVRKLDFEFVSHKQEVGKETFESFYVYGSKIDFEFVSHKQEVSKETFESFYVYGSKIGF